MPKPVNIIVFEGNLGADPELKRDAAGTPFCTFKVAQTVKRKVKGSEIEGTLWAEITIWGKIAESHYKNLHKGRHVIINGKMDIEDWATADGKPRYTFKIQATDVNYLDAPSQRGSAKGVQSAADQENQVQLNQSNERSIAGSPW